MRCFISTKNCFLQDLLSMLLCTKMSFFISYFELLLWFSTLWKIDVHKKTHLGFIRNNSNVNIYNASTLHYFVFKKIQHSSRIRSSVFKRYNIGKTITEILSCIINKQMSIHYRKYKDECFNMTQNLWIGILKMTGLITISVWRKRWKKKTLQNNLHKIALTRAAALCQFHDITCKHKLSFACR